MLLPTVERRVTHVVQDKHPTKIPEPPGASIARLVNFKRGMLQAAKRVQKVKRVLLVRKAVPTAVVQSVHFCQAVQRASTVPLENTTM